MIIMITLFTYIPTGYFAYQPTFNYLESLHVA